jgi:hypothetical protein
VTNCAAAADGVDMEAFVSRWLPDILLIGIKLLTVTGWELPEAPLTDFSWLRPAIGRDAVTETDERR